MLSFLIRQFISDYEDVKRPSVRKAYGNMAGTIGIVVNVILSAIKLIIGFMVGSIAIISDGFHNLVDVVSAVASIVSFKMAGKEPDIEHPYGHGRLEYLFSIGVSVIVISVGIHFFVESIEKILHPTAIHMTPLAFGIFCASLLGTAFLWYSYRYFAKKIDSTVLAAAGADSFSDFISSIVIIIGLALSPILHIELDGYLGIFAAALICHTGYEIFKESTNALIGDEPSPAMVNSITRFVRKYPGVLGIHDLMIHDYGPGHQFATIHVEVDANKDVMESHEMVDQIEKEIYAELGIKLTIHMDPLSRDEKTLATFYHLQKLIKEYDPNMDIHDLRMVKAHNSVSVLFDVVVPFGEKKSHKQIRNDIADLVASIDPIYEANITIEVCYTGLHNIHRQ